jgi:hypothetical protein
MVPFYTLALLLITTPESDVSSWSPIDTTLRGYIQDAAVQMQLLDSRERRYTLARPEDFASDLNLIRRRWRDLHNAPMMEDSYRFPDREQINEMLAFNRAYRQYIDTHYSLFAGGEKFWKGQDILRETERLYQLWDTVRDARCEYYYVTVRRQALRRLRDEMLGPKDYYAGQLPPYVPIWRFQVIHHDPKRVYSDPPKEASAELLRKPPQPAGGFFRMLGVGGGPKRP